MTNAVSDSIVVQAGAEAVWDVIADFEAYPEWQDDVKEVEILETDDDGWGVKVRFGVDVRFMHAILVLAYRYTDTEMHWWLVDGHGVRKNTGTYTLEPLGNGATHVSYELEVVPTMPVPGMMRRRAARHIIDAALPAMKERAELLEHGERDPDASAGD